MQGAALQQEFQLSPRMMSPAYGSPDLMNLSGSLPITPLAVDTPLSRLWHTPTKKR